jgi:hypothetical protein
LRGALTDPIDPAIPGAYDRAEEHADRRHDVAVKFAAMRFRIYGTGTAPSHLGNLLAGMPRARTTGESDDKGLAALEAKYRAWLMAAMLTAPCGRMLAHHVLEYAAVYEIAPEHPADLATLRRVLDVLLRLKNKGGKPAAGSQPESNPPDPQNGTSAKKYRQNRPEPIPAIFTRKLDGPDSATLLRAIARLKAGIVDGRGD